jgi:hypothetical protein
MMVRATLCWVFFLGISAPVWSADPPKSTFKSADLEFEVYQTDPEKGFYRGSRFDWAGVLGNVTYAGHRLFHSWKPQHDPTNHDEILGPVQEFSQANPLGYAEAKAGERFLKIGVGELEKPKEEKYRFTHPYKIVNRGERSFQSDETSARFQHKISTASGFGYDYSKRVWVQPELPNVIWILHSLHNTGEKTIETDVYNHNFFNVDADPIGPNYEIALRFKPTFTVQRDRAKELLKIEGTALTLGGKLDKGSIYAELTGFPENRVKEPKKDGHVADFTLRHLKSGISVGVWCDQPFSEFRVWGIGTTLCPEPFIRVKVEPGKRFNWTWRYEFAKGK